MDKLHEESRKQFEEYFEDFYGGHPTDHHDPIHVEGIWHAWQASRASIVVALPQRQSLCASGYGDGYFVPSDYGDGLEYDETVEALRSIGLSIKGE